MTDVMPVSDTALVTLWCRAAEARRDDALLDDPMAVRLVDSLDYDFDRFRLSADRQDLALRALAFDTAVRDYLATHPRATVVALGEGLQTSFWRLDAAGVGHEFRWLTLDLPPIVALRRQLLPESPRVADYAGSVLDRAWMDLVDPADGVFVTAEGLLPYLEPAAALDLIGACARHFPGGRMMFDLPPKSQARLAAHPRLWRLLRGDWPRTPFSLGRRERARLAATVPGVRAVHEVPLPAGRGPLFGTLLPRTRGGPAHRPLRWWVGANWPTIASLTLLEFDA